MVSDEWMEENMPGMIGPWHAQETELLSEKPKGFWLFNSERRRSKVAAVEVCHGKVPQSPVLMADLRLSVLY